MRKGALEPDSRIDLHGMTEAVAHRGECTTHVQELPRADHLPWAATLGYPRWADSWLIRIAGPRLKKSRS